VVHLEESYPSLDSVGTPTHTRLETGLPGWRKVYTRIGLLPMSRRASGRAHGLGQLVLV